MDLSDLNLTRQRVSDDRLQYTYQYAGTAVQLQLDRQRRLLRVETTQHPELAVTQESWAERETEYVCELCEQELGLYIPDGEVMRTTRTSEGNTLIWITVETPIIELVDFRGDVITTLPC